MRYAIEPGSEKLTPLCYVECCCYVFFFFPFYLYRSMYVRSFVRSVVRSPVRCCVYCVVSNIQLSADDDGERFILLFYRRFAMLFRSLSCAIKTFFFSTTLKFFHRFVHRKPNMFWVSYHTLFNICLVVATVPLIAGWTFFHFQNLCKYVLPVLDEINPEWKKKRNCSLSFAKIQFWNCIRHWMTLWRFFHIFNQLYKWHRNRFQFILWFPTTVCYTKSQVAWRLHAHRLIKSNSD